MNVMELSRFRNAEMAGYLHPEIRFTKELEMILFQRPESRTLEAATEILRCDGRLIFRLPLELGGSACSCYLYLFTNKSWSRALHRASAMHIMQVAARMTRAGFPTLEVLAALKPRTQLLNWDSLLISREIENVQELPSSGTHLYQVHETIVLDEDLLQAVASHIAALHNRGFVHGDLKTRHILVRRQQDDCTIFLVDLEKSRRMPAQLGPAHDLWAARDLIQFFASLPRETTPQEEIDVRSPFLDSYFQARLLSDFRRRGIRRWVELYRPGGRFQQGRTLLDSLLDPSPGVGSDLARQMPPQLKEVQSGERRPQSPTS